MFGIAEAAKYIGLNTTCGYVNIEMLKNVIYPCILHWNQNHFVVLYKVSRGRKFYIADPGKGMIIYNKDELRCHWIETNHDKEEKGIMMIFEPTPNFFNNEIVPIIEGFKAF